MDGLRRANMVANDEHGAARQSDGTDIIDCGENVAIRDAEGMALALDELSVT